MASKITVAQVAARYNVSIETIFHWSIAGRASFPEPRWDEYELRRWDLGQVDYSQDKWEEQEAESYARMIRLPHEIASGEG